MRFLISVIFSQGTSTWSLDSYPKLVSNTKSISCEIKHPETIFIKVEELKVLFLVGFGSNSLPRLQMSK
jgi:hypothetical protein